MTTQGPRFLDEDDPTPRGAPAAQAPAGPEPGPDKPRGPALLEPESDAPDGLDVIWKPDRISRSQATRTGAMTWVILGLTLWAACWTMASCLSAVLTLAHQSAMVGIAAGLGMAIGLGIVVYGLGVEWRAYRSLQRVDSLRTVLAGVGQPFDVVRTAAQAWVRRVAPSIPDVAAVERSLASAESVAEITAVLRNRVVAPLHAAALQAGRRAALDGAGLIAISPHASWDGVIASLRGLVLIRQVAVLHGLRPGVAVSLMLLRKVGVTAVGTAGIELLSKSLADHALSNLPVARHLAGALPGTGVAALRLYRLAGITAAACSPVPA